jgi:phospholipase/carboxylesterase
MKLMHTAQVPAGDGPFPTVILLHGWGASAHDLFGLAPYLHGGRAVVLCPQGPLSLQIAPGMVGHGWFRLTEGSPPDLVEVAAATHTIEEFIDEAMNRYPIDPRHVVLGGFSQGGFMAYQIALRAPERFAGLMALSSWLPKELAGTIEKKPAYERLAALVVHGLDDPMIAVDRGRESRDALLKLGIPTVYREYSMGHEIAPEALREIISWLEEKVLPLSD